MPEPREANLEHGKRLVTMGMGGQGARSTEGPQAVLSPGMETCEQRRLAGEPQAADGDPALGLHPSRPDQPGPGV